MCCSGGRDQLTGRLLEPRGPPAQATERWRGGWRKGKQRGEMREKKHQQAKRRRIHLSSPLLQKLSHLRFHIPPFFRALHSLPPPTAMLSSPQSLPTPMEVDRVVRSMTTRLATLAEALRRMWPCACGRLFEEWPCHV